MTTSTQNDLGARAAKLFLDVRLLLILFVSFRLLLLVVYIPLFNQGIERGVSAGGDFFYYFQLGSLSQSGLLPFRDWWSEFPPIPSLLNVLIFQTIGRNYTAFAMGYGALMLLFDVGNLLLVRRIGARVYDVGTGMGLAWIYALLLAPVVMMWWNFEVMVAFFMLASLATLLEKREARSAVYALIGTLTKFTPALVLGAVWRFRPNGNAARYTAIVVCGFAIVYVLLFAQNAAMTLPSLTAQFNKPSYQTVWALIDGNYRTGNFGPALERLDPANAARVTGNPAVVPGVVRLAIAAAIGAIVFLTTRRRDARGLLYFVTITLLIFFLQAQGWSPQWLAQIVPLLLLAFPNRQGLLGVVLLMFAVFVEYPFLFIRTGDTGGVISGALIGPFTMLIVMRTLLLVGFCIALYRGLRQETLPSEAL